MTLPDERTRSVQKAREFLRRLLDPKQTPKIPKAIRKEAYWVLKHFPSDLDLHKAAEASEVWGAVKDGVEEQFAVLQELRNIRKKLERK